jgi:CRP-like cAMP-binding protein
MYGVTCNAFALGECSHVRKMREAAGKDLSVQTLLPYMTRSRFNAGKTLVRKGERADRLYYLLGSEIEVVEISQVLHAGVVVGEIAVFALLPLSSSMSQSVRHTMVAVR